MGSLKTVNVLNVFSKSGKKYELPDYKTRQESKTLYELPVPVTNEELDDINPDLDCSQLTGRQKLIMAIKKTFSLNRSPYQAMILLIGPTVVGKSSIINHLFNITDDTWNTIAHIDGSQTVKEYLISVDSPTFEDKELQLGFVDSLGFQDTQNEDAKNIEAMKLFLETHPKMQSKYPNLIFICFAATDKRFDGDRSNFVKSLRSLKELDIVDVKNPNIIVIITKCCQLDPNYLISDNMLQKWIENIEILKKRIKTLVLNELDIDAPIVILENNYEDQGLERPRLADGSPSDFTLLPNEDLQPYNLFVSCLETMQRSGDLFGEIIFNACFMDGSKAVPKMGFEILTTDYVPKANISEHLDTEKDFFSQKVETFFKQSELEEKEKPEIYRIKAELKKLGVSHEEEMCLVTPEAVGFSLPNGLSVRGREFLEKYLNIRSNEIKPEISEVILHGYNILNDRVINTRIFNKTLVNHEYGFRIPDGCTINKVNDDDKEVERSDQFRDMIGLVKHRLQELNLDFTDADLTRFNYPNRPRCVVDDVPNSQISRLYEYRLFRIDCESIQNLTISDDFKQDVKGLPEKFNPDDTQSRGQFESFFNKWGHYVVVSVYGGGYCESKMSKNNGEDIESELRIYGGNTNAVDIKSLDEKDKINQWKISLILNPLILKRELSLVPISDVVRLVSREKGKEISKAFHVAEVPQISDINIEGSDENQPILTETQDEVESEGIFRRGYIFILSIFNWIRERCFGPVGI